MFSPDAGAPAPAAIPDGAAEHHAQPSPAPRSAAPPGRPRSTTAAPHRAVQPPHAPRPAPHPALLPLSAGRDPRRRRDVQPPYALREGCRGETLAAIPQRVFGYLGDRQRMNFYGNAQLTCTRSVKSIVVHRCPSPDPLLPDDSPHLDAVLFARHPSLPFALPSLDQVICSGKGWPSTVAAATATKMTPVPRRNRRTKAMRWKGPGRRGGGGGGGGGAMRLPLCID